MADARSWPIPAAPYVGAGVMVSPGPPLTRFSLRTRDDTGLPPILRAAPFGAGHALALGPDEWLVLLPDESAMPPPAQPHALTNVSDRSIAIVVEGERAAALLNTGVALDLSPAAFPPGKVARTVFEGVEIVLWRTADARFHVEVWRSFATWLHRALTLAAG